MELGGCRAGLQPIFAAQAAGFARKTEDDMKPSQFGNAPEENNPTDPIEQAARASERKIWRLQ